MQYRERIKVASCLLLRVLAAMICISASARATPINDAFIAGYASALLEREFNLPAATVQVQDGVISLQATQLVGTDVSTIQKVLATIRGVVRVDMTNGSPTAGTVAAQTTPPRSTLLPKGRLFEPLIADQRWPHFSLAYQYHVDDDELRHVAATSFGETLPLYRSTAPFGGQWQVGVHAAVFAIFDLTAQSFDLVNADYWAGLSTSYRKKALSALLRVFHQSSHLGDEFLLRNRVDRINLSYEGIDVTLSYEVTEWLRLYAGGGFLLHRKPTTLDPWSTQAGLELKSPWSYLGGSLRPVLGLDVQHWQENDWATAWSVRAGLQLESPQTVGHKIQLMFQYFNGHSPHGQFYDRAIENIGLGVHFYY